MTKALRHFWIGFKNAFNDDIEEIKHEYSIRDLWETTSRIDKKLKRVNEQTDKKIKKHLQYPAAY